jgi:glycosyltransferase involved in cell wall biosynthesis
MRVFMLLSVIIPTRNRKKALSILLDSLAHQNPVNFEWEVLVIDNASTDGTDQLVLETSPKVSFPLRHILETRIGLHYGRHTGAREARGTIVAYLDDDMILSPSWLSGVTLLVKGKAEAVVGRIFPKWEQSPPAWLESMVSKSKGIFCYLGFFNLGSEVQNIPPTYVFGGNCFIFKQLVFDLGGFHPDGMPADKVRYRGDGETALMLKFQDKHLRSFYDPRAETYHVIPPERMTVEYLKKRAYNQGISDSFTAIRQEHFGGPTQPQSPLRYWKRFKQNPLEFIQAVFRRISNKIRGLIIRDPIEKDIQKSYLDGYNFHQKEVENDPVLHEWVLRDTFIE